MRIYDDWSKIPSSVDPFRKKVIDAAHQFASESRKAYGNISDDFFSLYCTISDKRKNASPDDETLITQLAIDNFFQCTLKLKQMKFYLKLANEKCDYVRNELREMKIV